MAAGLTLALIPGSTVIWFLIFIPLMLVRINQAALIGTMAVGRLLMPLVDPLSERLGFILLNRPELYEPMGHILSLPLIGWLRLDDSMVFGGMIIGIAAWPLWFLICLLLVGLYRKFLASKLGIIFRRVGEKVPFLGKFGKAVSAARSIGGIS
ncbi:MAG: hypothetical protein KAJ98_10100 [Spirochaetaceae bacterium]|nr:hypothetical protein [Spirochaetaceae bacterium]